MIDSHKSDSASSGRGEKKKRCLNRDEARGGSPEIDLRESSGTLRGPFFKQARRIIKKAQKSRRFVACREEDGLRANYCYHHHYYYHHHHHVSHYSFVVVVVVVRGRCRRRRLRSSILDDARDCYRRHSLGVRGLVPTTQLATDRPTDQCVWAQTRTKFWAAKR